MWMIPLLCRNIAGNADLKVGSLSLMVSGNPQKVSYPVILSVKRHRQSECYTPSSEPLGVLLVFFVTGSS
jgi:hypothetical protein